MSTVTELLNHQQALDKAEAQRLLGAALGNKSRAWLYAHGDDTVTDAQAAHFQEMASRRSAGEPIAYILGHQAFWQFDLLVSPDVLIPRPETEILVEEALTRLAPIEAPTVLDLGTGSGAIALAIAYERPDAAVTGVDISAAALHVAQSNLAALKLKNVTLQQGTWLSRYAGPQVDMIVSNPPYVAESHPNLAGELKYEPIGALASGAEGLEDIEIIVEQAPEHLKPGGWLLMEHGYDQRAAIINLLESCGWHDIAAIDDLAGIARVIAARYGPAAT